MQLAVPAMCRLSMLIRFRGLLCVSDRLRQNLPGFLTHSGFVPGGICPVLLWPQ